MVDAMFRWLLFSILVILVLIWIWTSIATYFDLRLESFLKNNQAVIISIGTLFLISLLTLLTTHLANSAAKQREKFSRRVQAELKIADFRQKWINDLRSDFAEFTGVSMFREDGKRLDELVTISTKISLRLNHGEELSGKIVEAMRKAVKARMDGDTSVESSAHSEVMALGNQLLKQEWARLKNDLQTAQNYEDMLK